jgi:hypothetical protein
MTSYTPLLHLPQVAPNQDQKEATINTALAILEAAMNDVVVISLAAGNVTLNEDQFTKYFHHQFAGHSAPRTVTVPDTPRWFSVENLGSATLTLVVDGSAGLTAELASGKIGLVISDGVDIRFVVPDPTGGLGLLTDLSDVSGVPTDGQLLRWVAADSNWKPWTLSLAFSSLSDFPGSYISHASNLLAVKADGTGLEWVSSAANVNSFTDLDDTPSNYSGAASRTVKVNSGGTGLVFAQPRLTEAADFPSSYSGAANQFPKINGAANALVFTTLAVADLSDGPGAPDVGNALKYVRVSSDGSTLEYGTGTGGPDAFIDLTDTPASYTGEEGKVLKVNPTGTGVTFGTVAFTALSGAPASYTGAGGQFVQVKAGTEDQLIFAALEVADLSDGPGAYAGKAKQVVRVKSDASALEYFTIALTDLLGFPSTFTGQSGKFLQVKGDESGLQFVTSSTTTNFLALTDTPSSYSGKANQLVVVNASADGLTFRSAVIPVHLGDLADVEAGTGTPADGAFLRWIDGVWQADPYTTAGAGAVNADTGFFIQGQPSASETCVRFVVATGFTVATATHQGSAGTASTASKTFEFKKNGTNFATANFAISATTATFTQASPATFAAGDVLSIVAPGTVDVTLADISFTLKATR